jgi:hypothetical protein
MDVSTLLKARDRYHKTEEGFELILWRDRVMEEVDALSLPAHVIASNPAPWDRMIWGIEQDESLWLVESFADDYYQRSLTFWNLADIYPPEPIEHWVSHAEIDVRYHTRYPEEVDPRAERFLKMLAFLNSPYVSKEVERAPRSERRRAEREGKPDPGTVRVIYLRNPEGREYGTDGTGEGAKPGETGHWHVRGHLRAQWYATEEAHHVIWIAPQIRGDLTKPLKQKAYVVSR